MACSTTTGTDSTSGQVARRLSETVSDTAADSFKDHFKAVARQYSDSRPTYPKELFAWLASQCPAHERAWDCGTGSGQAALDLAAHFGRVLATDASSAQIGQAKRHDRVEYRVAPAEDSGLESATMDLVVVAQALHWFDVEAFHREALRVLKPEGVIAEWCYGIIEIEDEAINRPIQHFYGEVVGPYWPPERRHVETGYGELPFPFRKINSPAFSMRLTWSLDQLLGYLRSWSATARYIKTNGIDPVEALAAELSSIWDDSRQGRAISWPLALRVGARTP